MPGEPLSSQGSASVPAAESPLVEVRALSRMFGKIRALAGVDLDIPTGVVVGLVGANGHGKTTLIKHLLGLLRPQHGSVRVFGLAPDAHPAAVLSRVGYLSEHRDLPEWMRISEYLRYTAAFYPRWDDAYARELLATFRLDPTQRIKSLSKGMRAQVGLIGAVAHRPDLLVLDEPSTGLDAVVRKDILNAIVRAVAEDGRTVLFSSHLLDEVEMMSDRVVMINRGRVVLQGDLDDVKSNHLSIAVRFDATPKAFPQLDGLLEATRQGEVWQTLWQADQELTCGRLQQVDGRVLSARHASLQEIFVARAGRRAASLLEGSEAEEAKELT
ncbi:MAG: ABC transporter ATP-binding protein [Planctomycetales bacterium]|nr:ABC transporter ATP-binding protein [Planctomycetales bacterium]